MRDTTDVTYLLFGQAMPQLDADVRMDVVELINDGEHGLALDLILKAIKHKGIEIDTDLLSRAQALAPQLI